MLLCLLNVIPIIELYHKYKIGPQVVINYKNSFNKRNKYAKSNN